MKRVELKSMSKMAFVLTILGALIAGLFLDFDGIANAYTADATDSSQVTVTVNNKTIIDVTPAGMDWGNADPGTVLTQYTDTEDGVTLSQIQIENMGSTDITYVWANVSQPSSNPFGTGNLQNYDSGNWLLLKPTDYTGANMSFVDRVEFNSSTDYIYLQKPDNWVSFGKIRDANHEYFWVINATTSTDPEPYCNGSTGTDADIVIGVEPHNTTNTGTIDLIDGNVKWANIGATGDSDWGLINGIEIGGTTYCVAVYYDCSKIRIFRWNADAPGASSCTAFGGSQVGLTLNNGNTIYPGDSLIADVELHVPYGVPDGNVPTGTLTILASTE